MPHEKLNLIRGLLRHPLLAETARVLKEELDASCYVNCPECQQRFLPSHRQIYCSKKCTKRMDMRNWRKTPLGKESERKLSEKRREQRAQINSR